jgi:hypothetical protein
VEIRVLGPIEVVGASRAFERTASLELVVYLAMHPRGVTTDAWATALWPDRLAAPATLHSTASAARHALGRSAAGTFHLPRGRARLRLASSVAVDWWRLGALAGSPDPERWLEGLQLVRGRPFEGLRALDWTVLEGFAADTEEVVVGLALRLGESRLGAGDGDGAAWAAQRGLLAAPFDERLHRLVLRAADLRGNRSGVESAMGRLLRLLGAEGLPPEPIAAGGIPPGWAELVHPETLELYRSLSGRATGGACVRR